MVHDLRRYPDLGRLLRDAARMPLDDSSKVVVFSDLHLGNGGRNDEFLDNSHLFRTALLRHYLPEGFGLVLNGDIEELMKFSFRSIYRAWSPLYALFARFARETFFLKIWGNHDLGVVGVPAYPLAPYLHESLALRYGTDTILLFHGHQASPFLRQSGSLFTRSLHYLLRYIARPTGIRNYSVSHESRRRYAIEKAIYEFSNRAGIISLIGHTHRPLFESLSKVDYLNYRIEDLCREYAGADERRRGEIESEIGVQRDELDACYRKGFRKSLRSGRYGNIVIPSIFNSGCAIGKRGITAIEIDSGVIRLVYWQDGRRVQLHAPATPVVSLAGGDGHFRTVLNEERLDYVFSRIRLLAGERVACRRVTSGSGSPSLSCAMNDNVVYDAEPEYFHTEDQAYSPRRARQQEA